ncbi:MAG: UDP-N-acetylmuramoyl-L-alanyl-D-glutamate--2,6-diaminopimelate ligase [Candidatus Omnitrophica bacterium]|nr:UDP-N-acetylmuramoyl-L-alanyl-D-glutamate--2,6-diaminopimelate ligase [Candidatus Omnitrophota bacterium]MCM8799212.1 UDP-N-acetylmuramoyl-L-alanyl-D-glutamate--2,6-diaminopimelate ligase [Candidatus Omnitrophota bacterium]
MRLTELIKTIRPSRIINFKDIDIKGITCDSRKVKKDFIFVAIKGFKDDGFRFIPEAIKRGAKVVVSYRMPKTKDISGASCIIVKNTRKTLSELSSILFKAISQKIKLIGITGTNGKTTTAYFIENILKRNGKAPLVIGTIDYHFKDKYFPSLNTTPSIEDTYNLFSEAVKEGINYAVMEVSSHALSQDRVAGLHFSYAIFTNLSRDHLDYHKRIENYFSSKAKLFLKLNREDFAIINYDDPYGKKLLKLTKAKIISYGLNKKADFFAYKIKLRPQGSLFTVKSSQGRFDFFSPLIGRYNLYNILAGICFAFSEGLNLNSIREAMVEFNPPSGRLQKVKVPLDYHVFVDYAHTPSALKEVLLTLKGIFKKRIILVFGCGGDRDRGKRPQMGRIATELADLSIITSDNPRSEDPLKIAKDILRGIKKKNYKMIIDRKEAIFYALSSAKRDDVVLIAGKGHENYQIIKDKKFFFNDCKVVQEYFKSDNV